MANQSSKRNEKSIKLPVQILTYTVYGSITWFLIWNMYYLLSEQISILHILLTFGISYLSLYCFKTVVKFL